ncbi:hypothetical protein A2442_02085 [Candidatus Campbellbacteria bacterium RIFOXYC2_FULL_35_25]|uniref:Uncharacterized protein n=1 Tax=Candidatus Campbellbacteria bacterium RIFOXYC2_FULL_35_25 TaxID=1797582 RepID=A0A1F5EIC5_9BACT|nr:MAG: hypothetical protein A2442_02085 [Candidatus Campbellbacteria bacterium RIFOXYC2_FULL_35_25]
MRHFVRINPSLVEAVILHTPGKKRPAVIFVGLGTRNDPVEIIERYSSQNVCDISELDGTVHVFSTGNC